jgi:pilus assembly protein CpaC
MNMTRKRLLSSLAPGIGPRLVNAAAVLLAAWACPQVALSQSAEDLRLTVGKSVVIDYPADVRQISTSNPDVIDASPVTTREILVNAKGLGSATMVVWDKNNRRTFYNITVDLNVEPLRRLLRDTFPNEDIQVKTSRESISLIGRVSSKEVADRAVGLAASFSKTVVSALAVLSGPAEKQVLLRVKFAQLDRTKELQYGVNLLSMNGQTIGGTTTGQFGPPGINGVTGLGPQPNQAQTLISQALNIYALNPKLSLGALVKALENDNVLQILAEPNLVTTNGKEASFLVGGEFPVPVLQGGGNAAAVTIQFREFGIRLRFTPVITENKTIKMELHQEVSTIDVANGVVLNGFVIPALATRRAETNVELGEGQSFVVAGLVDNRDTETFSKIPVLSSLPIFGALFKSKQDQKTRSELIMLVTPEITVPLGPNDPRPIPYMPKDFLVRLDPKDMPQPKAAKKK